MTKKLICICVMFIFGVGTASGLDFGVSIDSATGVRHSAASELTVSHADTVSFWGVRYPAESPIGFGWRAWYRYSLDRPVAFELDELYLTARIEGDTVDAVVRTGRFSHRDWGGTVFTHAQDGVRALISAGPADIRLFAGTTALIAGHRSAIFLSPLDEENRDALFGSPRVVSGLGIRLPSLFPGFTPILEGIAQFETRPDDAVAYDSQYVTLRLNQSIGAATGVEMVGSVMFMQRRDETIVGQEDLLGLLLRADLQQVVSQAAGLVLGARGWYASGIANPALDLGGFLLASYQPISIHRVATVLPISVGGTMGGRVRAAVKPFSAAEAVWLQEIQVSTQVTPVFRSTDIVEPIDQIDEDSEELYLGTEIGGGITLRPAPDFGVRIAGGVFLPGTALADTAVRWQASTNLSISF